MPDDTYYPRGSLAASTNVGKVGITDSAVLSRYSFEANSYEARTGVAYNEIIMGYSRETTKGYNGEMHCTLHSLHGLCVQSILGQAVHYHYQTCRQPVKPF